MSDKMYIGVRMPPLDTLGDTAVLVVDLESKKSRFLRHRCDENTAYGRKLKRVYGCHSPDGFNWGYGGSGPAELAFMLLLDLGIKVEDAWEAHQALKNDIVSRLPQGGSWTLTSDALLAWHMTYQDREAWAGMADTIGQGMTSIGLRADAGAFHALARSLRLREARSSVSLDHGDAGTHVVRD